MRLLGGKSKQWAASQKYELEHAIGFMDAPFFRGLIKDIQSGKHKLSTGYRDESMLREFFGGSRQEYEDLVSHIAGRTCLEIGPCVASQIAGWDNASKLIVVEPLLEAIISWQRANLGGSAYDGMIGFARPAEERIPELVAQIDGAILCRNMLDHTPHWREVLGNIAAYAAPGCKLLLWTDLDHRGEADEGHYDIASDTKSFAELVRQLGFKIRREYSDTARAELNWGCLADRI